MAVGFFFVVGALRTSGQGAQGAGGAAGVGVGFIILGTLAVLAAFLPLRTFARILAAVGAAIAAGLVSASLGFLALVIALAAGALAFYLTYRIARRTGKEVR